MAVLVAGAVLDLGAVQVTISEHGQFGTSVATGFLTLMLTAYAALLVWWRRRSSRRAEVVDRAMYLWRRAWYCRRCGVVSVLAGGDSHVFAARNLAFELMVLAGQLHWRKRA
ncbi:hypothetical protein [Winogradskya humida]|uniref:hypothetical protein n=1 Tax=Winogradskya humida TaxID=113566 RepID=UPI00194260FE|nr:hypothetical protein [Actinoplanes humidus]